MWLGAYANYSLNLSYQDIKSSSLIKSPGHSWRTATLLTIKTGLPLQQHQCCCCGSCPAPNTALVSHQGITTGAGSTTKPLPCPVSLMGNCHRHHGKCSAEVTAEDHNLSRELYSSEGTAEVPYHKTEFTGAEGGSCALPSRAHPCSSGAWPGLAEHSGPSTS